MPRKPRIFYPEAAYHIIARGNNRQPLFLKSEDYERYLAIIRNLKSEFPFDVFHYCLMTNHVHLLLKFESKESFHKTTHRLTLLYAKHYTREYKHIGHVFQDRFKAFPVENDGYLLECGRYIERNPIKAKITDQPDSYPWSSYRYYALGHPDPVVTENPLFCTLGQAEQQRQGAYKKYVVTERPYESEMEKILFGKFKPV